MRTHTHPRSILVVLLVLATLAACSNIPQSGRVAASCEYKINSDKSVDLIRCVPEVPATYTPSATSTAVPTAFSTPTPIVPLPTPTPLPGGATNTPGPTATAHPGAAMQGVIRNGSVDRVRIRNCYGMSEADPYKCPQAQKIGKSGALELQWVNPGIAVQIYRRHWPTEQASYVWAALSHDSITSERHWIAVCFNGQAYLELYNMNWYTGSDPLGEWYERWQANPELDRVDSCAYPAGIDS